MAVHIIRHVFSTAVNNLQCACLLDTCILRRCVNCLRRHLLSNLLQTRGRASPQRQYLGNCLSTILTLVDWLYSWLKRDGQRVLCVIAYTCPLIQSNTGAQKDSFRDRRAEWHQLVNKAVIDRRLRPRCCHLCSYLRPSRPIGNMHNKKLSYRRGTARCVVSWNLANCDATVQKIIVRQVLNKSKLWSWRVKMGRCVINICTQPWRIRVAFIVL